MRRVVLLAASATAYKVEVVDRCVTGKPLITGSSIPGYPYVLNPALPWEIEGMTPKVVYTDGIKVEAEENTFTVYAGGADAVVESFTIRVVV